MTAASALSQAAQGPPRLVNLRGAAAYLGVSYWSVRDWVLAGALPIVELPALRPREGEKPRKSLRRVLIDVHDLDAFVDRHKSSTRDNESRPQPKSSLKAAAAVPALCPTSEAQ